MKTLSVSCVEIPFRIKRTDPEPALLRFERSRFVLDVLCKRLCRIDVSVVCEILRDQGLDQSDLVQGWTELGDGKFVDFFVRARLFSL